MNLDGLINGLNRFARYLDKQTTNRLLKKLGEYGVQYAKSQVLNVDTGETVESINYRIEGNKLIIEAGGNAVWLEFGTGIARNPSAYPVQVEGIVGHGEYGDGKGSSKKGWYYLTDDPKLAPRDKDGELYRSKDGGRYVAHTFGIEQNMFMWKTIDVLEQKAAEWGLEIVQEGLSYD